MGGIRRRSLAHSSICFTVTESEPGKTFAFGVGSPGKTPLNVWRYDIAPSDGGSDVTESFTLAPTWGLRFYWLCLGWARGKTNRNGMRTTLERIKAEVEQSAPA